MKAEKQKVGKQIEQLRKQIELSQAELAQLSGVSQSAISFIERGKRSPSTDTLGLLASALGVSASTLISNNEDTDRSDITETLYRRPQMRVLFDAAKDAPDDVLQKTADILEVLKNSKKS